MPCTECGIEERDVCQACFDTVQHHLQWALRQVKAAKTVLQLLPDDVAVRTQDMDFNRKTFNEACDAARLDPETLKEGYHCEACGRFMRERSECVVMPMGELYCKPCGESLDECGRPLGEEEEEEDRKMLSLEEQQKVIDAQKLQRDHEHWLGKLLAVLHGDGGQHLAEHGVSASTQAAIERYYAFVKEHNELEELFAQLEQALDECRRQRNAFSIFED